MSMKKPVFTFYTGPGARKLHRATGFSRLELDARLLVRLELDVVGDCFRRAVSLCLSDDSLVTPWSLPASHRGMAATHQKPSCKSRHGPGTR